MDPVTLELREVADQQCVAVISINRPDSANAFNADVMTQLTKAFSEVATNKSARAVIITGKGKHFSAGADLGWMKASAQLSYDENIQDSLKLTHMFEALQQVEAPTIAVVNGATYGGAVGLTAACDYAIATSKARFCLSEVKLGLLPAVILPYLARKIPNGVLRRLGLTAKVFSAQEALEAGLVQIVCEPDQLDQVIKEELNLLLKAGPSAQQALKNLFTEARNNANQQGDYTAQAIAAARSGEEGQAGLTAFFAKEAAPWNASLKDDWKLHED